MAAANLSDARPYADINMTPLIDVMLVLLIIFIITIPGITHAIKIDNPSATRAPLEVKREVIDVMIDFDGSILWNQRSVDRAALQQLISADAQKAPQPEVHLTVDRFARYEVVAQTLADLQSRGLTLIGFVNNDYR